MIQAKYKHTNIVARDLGETWPPSMNVLRLPSRSAGTPCLRAWLAKGTGVRGASFSGVHLRLPGGGDRAPTLEIYQYARNARRLPSVANREGLAHIAFEVADVARAMRAVLKSGGRRVGDIASAEVEGVGFLTFVYVADPEGNIIEAAGVVAAVDAVYPPRS